MGDWEHAKTVYPDEYEGPRLKEVDYITKNPEDPKSQSKEEVGRRDTDFERAKTIYPPEYTPPKIDDKYATDKKKPASPMV